MNPFGPVELTLEEVLALADFAHTRGPSKAIVTRDTHGVAYVSSSPGSALHRLSPFGSELSAYDARGASLSADADPMKLSDGELAVELIRLEEAGEEIPATVYRAVAVERIARGGADPDLIAALGPYRSASMPRVAGQSPTRTAFAVWSRKGEVVTRFTGGFAAADARNEAAKLNRIASGSRAAV